MTLSKGLLRLLQTLRQPLFCTLAEGIFSCENAFKKAIFRFENVKISI